MFFNKMWLGVWYVGYCLRCISFILFGLWYGTISDSGQLKMPARINRFYKLILKKMGLIKQGILGGFRKKTGTVVGAYWRRLDVIRALPRNSGKAPTQLQVNQQIKFGLVTSFLSNFSALIDGGFKTANSLSTPMNLAVSYHLREAIIGIEPNFELDLTKLTFSRGKLEMPLEVNATLVVGATIDLSWPHTEDNEKFIDATDIIQVLVYNPGKSKFVKVLNGASRADLTYSLQLPANFVGDEVHIYVAFSSTKKKMLNSNCTYLGTLTII